MTGSSHDNSRRPLHRKGAVQGGTPSDGNVRAGILRLYVICRRSPCEFGPRAITSRLTVLSSKRPTLLAKIFGCYKISFRKTHKDKGNRSKPTQMNLLVMENLFYDRRFSKIYDLKGSTRNRHVQSTGRENEVLLDENLVESQYYFLLCT